jgi:hypothetical protein
MKGELSASAAILAIILTASTGYFPVAVSPESMIASVSRFEKKNLPLLKVRYGRQMSVASP